MILDSLKLKEIKLDDEIVIADTINNLFKNVDISETGLSAVGLSTDYLYAEDSNIKNDYTIFEVFPTDRDILPEDEIVDSNDKNDPKSVASIFDFDNTTATNLTYKHKVLAEMKMKFELLSYVKLADSDIIIDFGDNTKPLHLNKCDDPEIVEVEKYRNSYVYTISHDYTSSGPGKYIVKISGTNYYGLRNWIVTKGENPYIDEYSYECRNNLVSRVFLQGTRLYRGLTNVASMFGGSSRLLRIDANKYNFSDFNGVNCISMFNKCYNLQYAYGLKYMFANTNSWNPDNFFNVCYNLVDTDFVIPSSPQGAYCYGNMFALCKNLQSNIEKLLPETGFNRRVIDISRIFSGCKKLKGTVPANILWNDTSKSWQSAYTNTDGSPDLKSTFASCSDEIRAQVPVSWGGTNSSIIVPKDQQTSYQMLYDLITHPDKIDSIFDVTTVVDVESGKTRTFAEEDKTSLTYRQYDTTLPKDTAYNELTDDENMLQILKTSSTCGSVGAMAFAKCKRLNEIKLGENCKHIAEYAFAGCDNIEYLNLPYVNTCANRSFGDCINLKEVYLENCTTGTVSFLNCTSLEKIIAPKMTDLGSSIVWGCTNLKEVDFSSAKTMTGQVFYNCKLIERISLPSMIEIKGEGCFQGCVKLADLDLSSITEDEVRSKAKTIWRVPVGCTVHCKDGNSIIID